MEGLDLAARLDLQEEGHEALLDGGDDRVLARQAEAVGHLQHRIRDAVAGALREHGRHVLGLPLAVGPQVGHVVEQPHAIVRLDRRRQRRVRAQDGEQVCNSRRRALLPRQRPQQRVGRVLRRVGQVRLSPREPPLLARALLHIVRLRSGVEIAR